MDIPMLCSLYSHFPLTSFLNYLHWVECSHYLYFVLIAAHRLFGRPVAVYLCRWIPQHFFIAFGHFHPPQICMQTSRVNDTCTSSKSHTWR